MLEEFESISERGGVLGAMETGYQRAQDPGGVAATTSTRSTTARSRSSASTRSAIPHSDQPPQKVELARSTDGGEGVAAEAAGATSTRGTPRKRRRRSRSCKQAVIQNGNVFEELMSAVRVCSLGQITNALFEVGGQYRRSM